MDIRRLSTWIAVPIAVALCLTACDTADSGSNNANTVNPDGVVSIGIGEPEHLLPSNTTDINGGQVLQALFTPLMAMSADGKPVPDQAASVTSVDGRLWTIKLKPGWTFHNGEPVNADSYLRAWNYAAYGPNGQQGNYYFARIEGYDAMNPGGDKTPSTDTLTGLEKMDDLTFRVTLSAPYSDLPSELEYTAFLPLPRAAFGADGTLARNFEEQEIGDGPFQIKGSWTHDQSIEVERYPAYPGKKPKVGGILFKIYQDLTTAYSDVLSNTLDVLPQLATQNLATAASDFGARYQHSPMSSFQFIAFPTFDPAFSNVKVRRAISMAIDRNAIVSTIFANSQAPARSFVSPVVPGYRANTCGSSCEYNPAQAKQLYQDNNGPDTLTITYNVDGGHKEWVEATCNELHKNLGVECTAQPDDKLADLLDKVEKKQPVGMFRLGWVMDYPSMEDYLTPLYSTHGASNYYGYSDPQFDNLVQKGSEQPTEEKAISYYQQAEDILARDMPVIPLRFGQNNYVYSTRVSNVSLNLFQFVDLIDITTSAT